MKTKKVFGKHLTADIYGIGAALLQDPKYIFDLLDTLPVHIGMRKLSAPYVVICRSEHKKEWGISGFVLLYESHISCHTWPENCYVSMDVYSCRNFDHRKTIRFIKNAWGGNSMKIQVFKRG